MKFDMNRYIVTNLFITVALIVVAWAGWGGMYFGGWDPMHFLFLVVYYIALTATVLLLGQVLNGVICTVIILIHGDYKQTFKTLALALLSIIGLLPTLVFHFLVSYFWYS